jgi:hypothetical protein
VPRKGLSAHNALYQNVIDASRLNCPLFGPSSGKDEEGYPSLLPAEMAGLRFLMRLFVRVAGTVQPFLQRCGRSKALEREQKSGTVGMLSIRFAAWPCSTGVAVFTKPRCLL